MGGVDAPGWDGIWTAGRESLASGIMDVDETINALLQRPVGVDVARRSLPDLAGIYAWWTDRESIPGVPECPHPDDAALQLFYVGIAPRDSSSSATLKSRVVKNHLSGNTGASTFRFTLASLLMESLGLAPEQTKTRAVLSKSQNQALSEWQKRHLRLTWAEHDRPWLIEDAVISRLEPPLNLAGNASHPFHPQLTQARARFREAAKGNPRSP